MAKTHIDKIENELKSLDLNLAIQFAFIWDLLVATDETTIKDIVYSKSYFARYYCVDLATFHKWIQIFCPNLYNAKYKSKKIFNETEATYILKNLGTITLKKMPPQVRKELMEEIYKDTSWKKSKRYNDLALDLEDRFPNQSIKLNKLPPKFIFEFMKEGPEEFENSITLKQDEFFRSRIHAIQSVFSKYQQLSDHKKEVYRRWFRRWLMDKDIEETI